MEHPKEKFLIIRVDANTQIGTGHLMRCLALAQAWKDAGGEVIFITACQSEGLLQRLREEGFELHVLFCLYPDPSDWAYTKDILAVHPNAWVVLDGYHFDEVYQRRVKEAGHRLLVIDDMAHLKHYYADIVLNQNLHAEQLHYSCEAYTRLLLGSRYVLLRREFLAWRDWKRVIPEVARRVLVTLGGGDPANHTLKVIQALQKVDIPALEAIVAVGATNPHTDVLEKTIRQSQIPIRLIHNARNMPELMAWADVAVSAAGATTWEHLFVGVPTLFLVLADNQHHSAEEIERCGVGKTLGQAQDVSVESLSESIASVVKDFDLRKKISQNARQIVDGRGSERVIAFILEIEWHKLKLRPATSEDGRLLWQWRNDPVVRANSFNPELIRWEKHLKWFREKLADPHCLIYVVEGEKSVPIGQVRFDINSKGSAEVDVSIDAKERNKGYGSAALKLACRCAVREFSLRKVLAHIKKGNKASINAFTKAGFINKGQQDFKGYKAVEMVWPEE